MRLTSNPSSPSSAAPSRASSPQLIPSRPGTPPALDEAESLRIRDGLDVAQALVDEDQAQTALAVLLPLPGDAAPRAHYGYEAKLGLAFMGRADELVAASALGAMAVPVDGAAPQLRAERVGCYVGVLGAYGRMAALLAAGPERERFIEKNSEATLSQVLGGVSHGMAHAFLETMGFFNVVASSNLNRQTGPAMMRMLASGRLTMQDPVVLQWFANQRDPLIQPILSQTQHVQLPMGDGPFALAEAWGTWAAAHKARIIASPAVQQALQFMPSLPEVQQAIDAVQQDPVVRAQAALAAERSAIG